MNSSLRNRLILIYGLFLSNNRMTNRSRRHLFSSSILRPSAKHEKSSVTSLDSFYLSHVVLFLIVLKDATVSQNTGNAVAFSLPIAIRISWAEKIFYVHQHHNLLRFARLCINLMLPQQEIERLFQKFQM